ncbi:MAG: translation initiation factor IF-3 [Firmicutes bacterium]|nr:translation initiation factor IF-3 [Bacillota bacterium]MDI6638584.1 translation initiation factor IF-3 [Bacillota bacterium]NLG78419.1 translation initiation factor IF-3 [Bacillota bacterium]
MAKDLRVNEAIRAREIRLIDENGEQLGIMVVREGLRIAAERGLDLVEVAPNAKPPVCRLLDYGKYKYEQAKRDREARKKQRTMDIKEVRMTPKIEGHDFQVKVRNAQKFLQDGDKVKATVRFRGREIVHADIGRALLLDLAEEVKDYGVIEREPRVEGKHMIMVLAPKQTG